MNNHDKPNGDKLGWQVKQTQLIYKSQWYNLRQDRISLPENEEITYTYVDHPGSVFIVPITPSQEVILIHSYRYTIDDWCWEVPAGNLGDQDGRSPEQVALIELQEEIGGEPETLQSLGWYYMANGFAYLKHFFFIAHNVTLNQKVEREATEVISQVKAFPIIEIHKLIKNQFILDGDSAFALMLALANHNLG